MTARGLSATLIIVGAFAMLLASKNAIMNVSNVTIVWMDPHSLVVSKTVKGKLEEVRFVLNSETVRKGDLRIGSHVTVHYTIQNHENVAMSVQVRN
jgi:hypothetical protein